MPTKLPSPTLVTCPINAAPSECSRACREARRRRARPLSGCDAQLGSSRALRPGERFDQRRTPRRAVRLPAGSSRRPTDAGSISSTRPTRGSGCGTSRALATVADVSLPQQPLDIAITPDGASVWVAVPRRSELAVSSIRRRSTVTATIPVGMSAIGIAITPDGQRALVTGDRASMVILDVATRTSVGSIPLTERANRVAVHPNGNTAYVSLTFDRTCVGRSISTTEPRRPPSSISYEPFGLAVSPDGSTVYVAARPSNRDDSAVFVIDTATNT